MYVIRKQKKHTQTINLKLKEDGLSESKPNACVYF